MKFNNIAAIALVIALAGACDNGKKKPSADGATNNTTAATNSGTAEQGAAKTDGSASATDLPVEATGPVAKVNGETITAAEFNEEVGRLLKVMGPQMPPNMLVNMKGQIIEQLVAKKLVEGAVKSSGVKVSDDEVDAEYKKFTEQIAKAAPGGVEQYLKQLGRNEADMKKDVRSSLELKKLMEKDHDIAVPAAEVKKYYDENKGEFDQPARVSASHILLKVDEGAPNEKVAEVEKRATELAAKAKAEGADFAQLARDNSEGPTAPRGGNLGFFPQGKMVPEFDKAAWSMKAGEVSDPVRTKYGFHIIKVNEKMEAQSLSFDEAKTLIEAKLQGPKLKQAMGATLEALKKDAKIEKMDQNIKSNVAAPQAPPSMFGGGGGGHPPITPPPGGNKGGGGGTKAPKLKLDKLK